MKLLRVIERREEPAYSGPIGEVAPGIVSDIHVSTPARTWWLVEVQGFGRNRNTDISEQQWIEAPDEESIPVAMEKASQRDYEDWRAGD